MLQKTKKKITMNKHEIIHQIEASYTEFTNYVSQLNDAEFVYSKNNKWSAGQQLAHLISSVKPLNQGLVLPVFVLKKMFGIANRPSKSYKELVAKYHLKLSEGGKATAAFIPKIIAANQKEKLVAMLQKRANKLCMQVHGLSETQLDTLIAPHPLLGKVTMREMLYFTAYHAQHHLQLVQQQLAK
jgi:hypothetical protein